MIEFLQGLFNAKLDLGNGQFLLWREVIGNVFGLLSALGGMRRKVWAWPVGILGNLLLFTVFLGSVFGSPNPVNLLGQAGRQILFILVSIYGWVRWRQQRKLKAQSTAQGDTAGDAPSQAAIVPQWATGPQRIGIVVALVAGTALLTPVFTALGSYEPVWADAWIFMGSLLATYGMAKGWVEFWLLWIAVDLVGVPLLWAAGYYASSLMYVFYGGFAIVGFFIWWRAQQRASTSSR